MMLGELEWIASQWDKAVAHFHRAEALVEMRRPTRATAQVLASLARFHMIAGENQEALRYGRSAQAMARTLGSPALEADALMTIGPARVADGDLGGIDDLEAGVALAESVNSAEVGRGYGNLTYSYGLLGDLSRARHYRRLAHDAAVRFGVASMLKWAEMHDVEDRYSLGEWDPALAAAEAFITEAETTPHYLVTVCLRVRAAVHLGRGRPTDAVADAATALAHARGAQHPSNLLSALPFYARCLFESGQLDAADAAITETVAVAATTALNNLEPIDTAIVLCGLGRHAEFVGLADRFTVPSRRVEVGRHIAAGDLVGAADLLNLVGHRSAEAYVRLLAAEDLGTAGHLDRAAEQAREALRFHRSVGATAYVRRAEAALSAR